MLIDTEKTLQAPVRLSFREKAGFGCGDFAFNLFFMLITLYGLYFYTDVIGISAASVGTLFLVARIWDAINDPLMGILADRTKSKHGRFRPYLLWMALPFGLSGLLCFIVPDWGNGAKIAYVAFTYVVFGMIYTAANLPYSGLMAVISPSPLERTKVSEFRFICSSAGGLLVATCVPILVNYFGKDNEQQAYITTAAIFSAIAVLLLLITFKTTKERIEPSNTNNSNILTDLKDLRSNLPGISLFFTSIFVLGSVSIHLANTPFYFKYYIKESHALFGWELSSGSMIGMFFTVNMVCLLLGVFLTTSAVKRLGKINAFVLLLALSCIFWIMQYYLLPSEVNQLFIYEGIGAFLAGPTIAIIFSMYADAADHSEWRTGRRATGLVMAFSSFGMKFGWALGGALGGWALAWFGYTPNIEQTPEAINGIRLMLCWVPAIMGFIACTILFSNPLKESVMNKVVAELQLRRATE